MTGNRVEELEGEVQELRATVSGLTDELVETKERLRLIEEHFGPELDDIISGKVTRTEARSELPGRGQQRDQGRAVVDEEPEPAPEPAADAEPEPDQAADATPDEESADEAKASEEEAEEESAGSDDIIVA